MGYHGEKLSQNGQFWTDAAQNVQFSSFPEKQKRHFFTLPKSSIHAKNQGNLMCGFLEKRLHRRKTERQTERERERNRQRVFNGPNSPGGRRTKN